jgi:hypothetical protein
MTCGWKNESPSYFTKRFWTLKIDFHMSSKLFKQPILHLLTGFLLWNYAA